MRNRFEEFIVALKGDGFMGNDQLVQVVLPLLEDVAAFHQEGRVAPLQHFDVILLTNGCLDINEDMGEMPRLNFKALQKLMVGGNARWSIAGGHSGDLGGSHGLIGFADEIVDGSDKLEGGELKYPVYFTEYKSYEYQCGHHDALTDIFWLGLVLASVASGLNLYESEDCRTFVVNRESLRNINTSLHPSIAAIIEEMIVLDRSGRSRDLGEVIRKLKNFREYNPEHSIDLTTIEGYQLSSEEAKQKFILRKLRSRLFDKSRRNRLLYFKSNMRFLNLTIASFPLKLDLNYIKPEHIFYWNDEIAGKLRKGKSLHLNKYLKADENLYVLPALDKIRLETQKDTHEYGMSQLRLVVAFLHWYNLKQEETERISTPFILMPALLKKKKSLGKEDDFILEFEDTEAEVNPILRYMLEETYGIKLPERLDLEQTDLVAFYTQLKEQMEQVQQGVQLRLIDKPRIQMIHNLAQKAAGLYAKRRRPKGGSMEIYNQTDYSYERDNYIPLGLQLFRKYISSEDSFAEHIIDDVLHSAPQSKSGGLIQGSIHYMPDAGVDDPYHWEFDLCHAVLGNFNYRKMSLVRDYNEALETGQGQHIFDQFFSENGRSLPEKEIELPELSKQYTVVAADPTQLRSVMQARNVQSYIIQGPPGTGKSQTITNLIADFIVQDKKVLFVCEKMAAIDVVYHRLQSKGLDEMCCLIHDSQGDKKNMILNLKATYESYLVPGVSLEPIVSRRFALIAEIREELALLEEFHYFFRTTFDAADKPVYELLNRVLEIEDTGIGKGNGHMDVRQGKSIPDYKSWLHAGLVITQLTEQLQKTGKAETLSEHPIKYFNTAATRVQKLSITEIERKLKTLCKLLLDLSASAVKGTSLYFTGLKRIISDALQLNDFARNNNLFLLDQSDIRSHELDRIMLQLQELQGEIEQVQVRNEGWNTKLPEEELKTALRHIERLENSFFKFLNATWWKVKKAIKTNYNFSRHQIQPAYGDVVKDLLKEYQLQKERVATEQQAFSDFRLKNLQLDWQKIQAFRSNQDTETLKRIKEWKEHPELVMSWSEKSKTLYDAENILSYILNDYKSVTIGELQQQLAELLHDLQDLPELLHYLEQLDLADPALQYMVRNEALQPLELEFILLQNTLQKLFKQYIGIEKLSGTLMEELSVRIEKRYQELMEVNALYVKCRHREVFMDKLKLTERSASGLSDQEKSLKKVYNNGRKILEHEFSKSRRYKSIRELAEGDAGVVLRDIKPVWLMSPLSVSDTLPLIDNYFDVVIFDEASQITLEEGIPPMFRATKSIIVGDEMQMPPTNFFGSANQDPDDLNRKLDDESEESMALDADSLLTQGSRKLNQFMLGWHYRSRNEALISYSNAAFYNGNLLTIPDRKMFPIALPELIVERPEDATKYADDVFKRTISYHYLPHGLYHDRKNVEEAKYIALMIREILLRKSRNTIGIVAFSMEQQGQIEDAISQLQQHDTLFDEMVEMEYQRTDEGHFTGLFVKNLENVQGEERDIIIISTCYGYNNLGKMYMNFGPINRRGGEKRLNVIFSRAKNNVVVVSSIKHTDIRNNYNDGARFFGKYLQYAELISNGAVEKAALVLQSLNTREDKRGENNGNELTVVRQIKAFLESEGWQVLSEIGQSSFKCSLAVKREEDSEFRLGILIDDRTHYGNSNVFEQYIQRPGVMRSFGWAIQKVLTKDWLNNTEAVKAIIRQKLL